VARLATFSGPCVIGLISVLITWNTFGYDNDNLFPVLKNVVSFVHTEVMARILVASNRNWCSFTQFLNLPIRRTPLTSFAVFSHCSRVNTVRLSTLQSRWISSQRNHLSSCLTLKRWQNFSDIETVVGCVRKVSSSKIVYTHDEHDKESGTTVNSSDNSDCDSLSEDDKRVSSDSAEDKTGSAYKAQPVSDVDVDKELLRYDYEEFEMIPDEEVSIVQPVKKSVPVELKSK